MKKSQSKKVNRAWLNDHVNDPWVKLAQKEGYRSRAVYKLKQIDEKFNLIKPDSIVVDLGCAPGAWSQYIQQKLSARGLLSQTKGAIFSLDILPMQAIDGVQFLQGDFREEAVLAEFEALVLQTLQTLRNKSSNAIDVNAQNIKIDLVVSDMAPNLSGIKVADSVKIAHLIELAVEFSRQHLRTDGALLVKMFHGSGYSQLVELFNNTFKQVKPIKPKASRDKSSETFLLGRGLR